MAQSSLITKVYVGFGLLLTLLVVVAVVGYIGFTGVQDRIEKTECADAVVTT